MNDHPALRRVLDDLSARPPSLPDICAEAVRRSGRIRRRRTAGLASGTAAVALVAVAVTPHGGGSAVLDTAADPLPTVLPSLPGVTPPPVLPSDSPSPKPSGSPEPSGAPSSADPASPGNGSSACSLRVTAPAEAPTATRITFTFHIRNQTSDMEEIVADWGDGRRDTLWGPNVWGSSPCPVNGHAAGDNHTTSFDHAYRVTGHYKVVVTARMVTGCGSPGAVRESTDGQVGVRITAGSVVSNGPVNPWGAATLSRSGPPAPDVLGGDVTLTYRVEDYDGWITRMVVDWQDGTAPTTLDFGTDGCTDTPSNWPRNRREGQTTHTYTAATGIKIPTVTLTSTGCDGKDAQTPGRTFVDDQT